MQIINVMIGIVNYIKESFEELKNHVTWTSWSEAQSLTILVAVFSIIFSLAIWGVDTVFSRVIKEYFQSVRPSGKTMHPYSLQCKASRILKYNSNVLHFVYPAPRLMKYTV